MAPDPRLDERSLAREAAFARRDFPRPRIEHFGSTTIGLTDGDLLGALVAALGGAILGLLVALAVADGVALMVLLPIIGAALGAFIESMFTGIRDEELHHRASTRNRPPGRGGLPAMRS